MFEDIKEIAKKIIKSRLFMLSLILLILFVVLVQRLFSLQIIHGQEYADNYTLNVERETSTVGTRGNIYDRNGKLLAYNELSNSVTIEGDWTFGRDVVMFADAKLDDEGEARYVPNGEYVGSQGVEPDNWI